jgi:hypothetical protein
MGAGSACLFVLMMGLPWSAAAAADGCPCLGGTATDALAAESSTAGETLRLLAHKKNRVLVTWTSRHCTGSSAVSAMETRERNALAEELGYAAGICEDGETEPGCLHLRDYLTDSYPPLTAANIGSAPRACLWVARGALPSVDPASGEIVAESGEDIVVWYHAYRLVAEQPDVSRVHNRGIQVVYR